MNYTLDMFTNSNVFVVSSDVWVIFRLFSSNILVMDQSLQHLIYDSNYQNKLVMSFGRTRISQPRKYGKKTMEQIGKWQKKLKKSPSLPLVGSS